MSDEIDRAQAREELDREQALAAQRAHAADPGPEPTGVCLYCGERMLTPRRWCSADCRDAWQHEHDLKMMRGVG